MTDTAKKPLLTASRKTHTRGKNVQRNGIELSPQEKANREGLIGHYNVGVTLPPLPGVGPGGQVFPERRGRANITYSVSTIREDDSPLVQLAYRSPLTLDNLPDFLKGWKRGEHGDLFLYPALFPSMGRNPVQFWANCQRIAKAVLLLFGAGQQDEVDYHSLGILSYQVNLILRAVTRINLGAHTAHTTTSAAISQHRTETLSYLRDYASKRSLFIDLYEPSALGLWAKATREVIDNVGSNLALCPHCRRLFVKGRTKAVFCSMYCRTATYKQAKRQTQKLSTALDLVTQGSDSLDIACDLQNPVAKERGAG